MLKANSVLRAKNKANADQNKNLVLSNELIKVNYHRETFRKLTFRALALRQSECRSSHMEI